MVERAQETQQLDYRNRPVALTIAGSDSGGGAGIQADLKTFNFYGVHGTSAITSVTAQNSTGVQGAQNLDASFVRRQIMSVASDFRLDAVKTGMLASGEIIEVVAGAIKDLSLSGVVVDPVMFAESGDRLLREDAVADLMNELLPLADVITPNIPEGETLVDGSIDSYEEMEEAADALSREYDCAVVLKGGHGEATAIDVLANQGQVWNTEAPRVGRDTSHGSGCAFASGIAANLAMGRSVSDAVERTKNFITEAIRWGAKEGEGAGCVEPGWGKFRATEVTKLQRGLSAALDELRQANFGRFIPEVQSNFAFALQNAKFLKDVAGFPGRIIRVEDGFRVLDQPAPGATDHMGRLVLAAMERDPSMRSALNIRHDHQVVQAARVAGLDVIEHDRNAEPEDVRREEGESIRFALERGYQMNDETLPDVLFDRGDVGKEAMVRILGTDPSRVAGKFLEISRNYAPEETT